MNKYFLLLIISFIPFCAKGEDNFIVKNTYVEGLYRIPKNIIISKIPFYNINGYSINTENIRNIIKSIFLTKYFKKITINLDKKNNLIIKLEENPIIISIDFVGNKLLKNEFLKKIIDKKKLYIKEPINEYQFFNIQNELNNIYNNEGNYNIFIDVEISLCSLNRAKIKFIFNEGKYSKIEKINIIGNNNFSTNQLLKKIKSYNYNLIIIKNLFKPIYKRRELTTDLLNLKNFYKAKGYLNFKIKKQNINFSKDKTKVFIDILISEGNKYLIKENELIGDFDNTYYKDIKKIILKYFKKNKYNLDEIEYIKNEIKEFLLKKGYSYPKINTTIIIIDNSNYAKLQFNIVSGLKLYVKNININGNDYTSDKIIRREIYQAEFSSLNPNVLLEDLDRLNKLKYFKNINVKTKLVDKDQVNLIYDVEEISFSGFKLGLNIGSKYNLNFECNLIQDNFLGNGNVISFKSNYNNTDTNIEFIINDPYFFKNKKIKVGNRIFFYNLINKNKDYNLLNNNYGFSNTLNFPIKNNFWTDYEIIFNKNNIKLYSYNENIFNTIDSLSDLKTILFNLENKKSKKFNIVSNEFEDILFSISCNYDNLNHIYYPTKGKKIKLNYKFTAPIISDNNYHLLNFLLENYFTDKKYTDFTLFNKTQIYSMSSFHKKRIPFYNYFYLEKIDLVRGFSEELSDFNFDYLNYFNERILNYNNIFNDIKFITKHELCIPTNILGDRYNNLARLSCFLDVGLEIKSKKKFNSIFESFNIKDYKHLKHIHISTGITLKIVSLIGPIKLSYIIPLEKCSSFEKTESFQFSIGNKW